MKKKKMKKKTFRKYYYLNQYKKTILILQEFRVSANRLIQNSLIFPNSPKKFP